MDAFRWPRSADYLSLHVIKILWVMACLLPYSQHVSDALPSNVSGPLDKPCPCLMLDESKLNFTVATDNSTSLRNTTSLKDIFSSLKRMEVLNACQSMFEKPPRNWGGQTNESSAVVQVNQLVNDLSSGCKDTCAVVASGMRLKGAGHGPEIDRADIVIRVKTAPVKGYEADVGSRTTLRVMDSASVGFFVHVADEDKLSEEKLEPDMFVMQCRFGACTKVIKEEISASKRAQVNQVNGSMPLEVNGSKPLSGVRRVLDRVRLLNFTVVNPVVGTLTNRRPSNGATAIAMAMMLCRNVSLYGFGDEKSPRYGYYYVDYTKKKRLPGVVDATHIPRHTHLRVHDMFGEWQTWKALSNAGFLSDVP